MKQLVIGASQVVASALHVVHKERTHDVSAVTQIGSIIQDSMNADVSIGHPRMLVHTPQHSVQATTQEASQVCTTGLAATTAMTLLATAVMVPHGKVAVLANTAANVGRTLEVDEWSTTSTVATVMIKTLAPTTVIPKA